MSNVSRENAELKKQIEEMQKQLALLLKEKTKDEVEKEYVEILPEKSDKLHGDDYIPVMSLTRGILNLSTVTYLQMGSGGKTSTFPSFGTIKRIMFSDLSRILS